MGIPQDNPAGRLYAILDEIRRKGADQRARAVFGDVFGYEPTDTENILYKWYELIQLMRSAKEQVQQLENVDHEIYLQPFSRLERAFSQINLEGNLKHLVGHLDQGTMVALQFCADALSREKAEGVIENEVLQELLDEVQSLIGDLVEADIPQELKIVLLENLESVRRAIIDYRIRGTEGLRRALETTIGSVIRHGETIKANANKPAVSRFLTLLAHVNEAVATGLKAKELFGPVVKLFLPSPAAE